MRDQISQKCKEYSRVYPQMITDFELKLIDSYAILGIIPNYESDALAQVLASNIIGKQNIKNTTQNIGQRKLA